MSLHAQDVQIQPAILVDIDGAGGPGPTVVEQADLGGNVDEVIVTEVAVKDTSFASFRLEMPREGVHETDKVIWSSLYVARVDAGIRQKHVQ